MGFFSHAAMLGVGYMIGKSYCFRYKVHQLPNDPDASEISFRVERKEGGHPMFWGHPWWQHQYYCHHPHYSQQQGAPAPNQAAPQKKNPELLELSSPVVPTSLSPIGGSSRSNQINGYAEILFFSFFPEKCHQLVKASMSKKSALEITFTPERNFMNVKIAPELIFDVEWPYRHPGYIYKIGDNLHLTVAKDEELIRDMLDYFFDTIKPLVSFNFDVEIRQDFAMELIRYCRRNNIRLSWIKFDYGASASPEYLREISEGCVGEDVRLCIHSSLPKGFEYTPPPGGFKLEELIVTNAHWVNLNDFLQCRLVDVSGNLSHMTPQYLNNVFKAIVNTKCSIRNLFLSGTSLNQNNYPEIIKELSGRPLEARGLYFPRVEFKARNGRETSIYFRYRDITLQIGR